MKTLTKDKTSPLVRAAVALDRQALQWSVTVPPEQAAELVAALQDYNEATRERLGALISAIDGLIPRKDYGAANPNAGTPVHEYTIGREYSRVLYVKIVKTYLADAFDFEALAERLKALAKEHCADERRVVEDDGHDWVFRVWWD